MSVSPSQSASHTPPDTHTHIHIHTHDPVYLIRKSSVSTDSLRNCIEMLLVLPKFIIAGQLIQLLPPLSVPCAHGVDREAEFGLSLYASDTNRPQEIVC